MHWRDGASSIEERSLALGCRKATLTRAGPQPTMFAWFQRSTQVRSDWAEGALCSVDFEPPQAVAARTNATMPAERATATHGIDTSQVSADAGPKGECDLLCASVRE